MRLHRLVTLAAPLALAALAGDAHAATYQRVYSFRGTDGNQPFGKMAFDPSGALYGCNDSALPLHATLWKLQPPAARVTAWKLTVLQDMGGSPCQGVIRDGMGRLFIDNEVAVTMFVPGSPPSWTTVIPVSPDEDSFSDITLGPQGQIFAAHDGGNSLVRALPGHGGWLLQTVYQFGVNDGATDPDSLSTGPDGTVYGTARGTSSVGGYLYQKSPSETGITFLTLRLPVRPALPARHHRRTAGLGRHPYRTAALPGDHFGCVKWVIRRKYG